MAWEECLTNYVSGFCNKKAPKNTKGEQQSCDLSYECVRKGIESSQGIIILEIVEMSLKEVATITVLGALLLFGLHSKQLG